MNISTENDLTVVCPAFFQRAKSGRKRLNAGAKTPPPESASIARVAKLMALALRFDRLVRDGAVENYSDLARLGGVSFSRITQIMNLLNLAPDIQEELLFLKKTPGGHEPLTEFELREIVTETDWNKQRRLWDKQKI